MNLMKKMHKRTITFFLDEADELLKLDRQQGSRLMRTLRACVMERSCRFIFAGFREVEHELSSPGTPFNFTTAIRLDTFHHRTAAELITVPMENLGITITNRDQLVRWIVHETAGHPNYIQHYCATLVKLLDETDTREITPDHLARVNDNKDFRMRILDTFNQNTDDFEKAVVFSVAHKIQFTWDELDREMKKRHLLASVSETEASLGKLEQLGVVSRENKGFKFVVPILPQLVQENFPAGLLFAKANEQIRVAQRAKRRQ